MPGTWKQEEIGISLITTGVEYVFQESRKRKGRTMKRFERMGKRISLRPPRVLTVSMSQALHTGKRGGRAKQSLKMTSGFVSINSIP